MDKTIATANALQRMLLRSLLTTPPGLAPDQEVTRSALPAVDAGETLPMHYRSEAFAEDLIDSYPASA